MLDGLDGEMPHILQRVAFAVIATSPIERMVAVARERGWRSLPLYSSAGNAFNRDYAFETPGGDDNGGFNVFTRKDGTSRHFWASEMGPEAADPGQDPRGAPDPAVLWTILDMTPGGRGTDWYPRLAYGESPADTVRRLYAAWPAKDRATVEALVADDFHFTSPYDNRIDRATFFARCWPNSIAMERIDLDCVIVDGDLVLVTYVLTLESGKRFRNTESLVVRDGKVHEVEVYFGWDLPHPAPAGGFVDPSPKR